MITSPIEPPNTKIKQQPPTKIKPKNRHKTNEKQTQKNHYTSTKNQTKTKSPPALKALWNGGFKGGRRKIKKEAQSPAQQGFESKNVIVENFFKSKGFND
ncbi:MAG: hypothetical protein ACKVOM_01550 [Ferruginibacter sp.]